MKEMLMEFYHTRQEQMQSPRLYSQKYQTHQPRYGEYSNPNYHNTKINNNQFKNWFNEQFVNYLSQKNQQAQRNQITYREPSEKLIPNPAERLKPTHNIGNFSDIDEPIVMDYKDNQSNFQQNIFDNEFSSVTDLLNRSSDLRHDNR